MKHYLLITTAVMALLLPALASGEPSADSLLATANEYIHFQGSTAEMRMQVIRDEKVEVEYAMTVYKLDSQRMRINFTEPSSEKGRKVLRVGEKMWMFLPDLGKPIVISARQSFLGSAFSNGDLLRTDLVADYTAALLRDESLAGVQAQVLELRARAPEVAYDRILMWIDQTSKRPLRQEFFTLSGKRIKSIDYGRPKRFGTTEINTEMRVASDLNPRERTVMTIRSLVTGKHLPASMFQKDSFER